MREVLNARKKMSGLLKEKGPHGFFFELVDRMLIAQEGFHVSDDDFFAYLEKKKGVTITRGKPTMAGVQEERP